MAGKHQNLITLLRGARIASVYWLQTQLYLGMTEAQAIMSELERHNVVGKRGPEGRVINKEALELYATRSETDEA